MFKKSGFTLIELLIVIAIIAILSIIGLVVYGNFMKNSRDAKRQADLKIIQSALEDYHADQIFYPLNDSVISGSVLNNTTGGTVSTITKIYLNSVPADPKGVAPYSYKSYKTDGTQCITTATECIKYCLFASMEGTPPTGDQGCTPISPYNYGVTRP